MKKPSDEALKRLYGLKKASFQIACYTPEKGKYLQTVKGYIQDDMGVHEDAVIKTWVVTDLATGQRFERSKHEDIRETIAAIPECRAYRDGIKIFSPEKYAAMLKQMKELEEEAE